MFWKRHTAGLNGVGSGLGVPWTHHPVWTLFFRWAAASTCWRSEHSSTATSFISTTYEQHSDQHRALTPSSGHSVCPTLSFWCFCLFVFFKHNWCSFLLVHLIKRCMLCNLIWKLFQCVEHVVVWVCLLSWQLCCCTKQQTDASALRQTNCW